MSSAAKEDQKSWNDRLLESHKEVFVKFYSPVCEHSIVFAPKYLKLAEKLQKFESIISIMIAEVDITKNDIPGIIVNKTPFLVFFLHYLYMKKVSIEEKGMLRK